MHIKGLPPDSATTRERLNAPLGWDNTTEQTANVVDAISYLTRHFINANAERPNTDPVERVPRPFAGQTPEPAAIETISLANLTGILKEHQ